MVHLIKNGNSLKVALIIVGGSALKREKGDSQSCQNTEPRRYKTAYIIDGPIWKEMILDPNTGDLHSWINGSSNRSTQGIPTHVVEPLRESFPPVLIEIFRSPIVEIWIESEGKEISH